ncbi:hypothetical protein FEM48_Zijuj05G0092400 [Ziziphus jujuba var. spinosa]|uniref:Uncharacterized protein n=1 Tax=Ziziphus jujuba var. spinosa TaxID=714518 RepID=A0A978VE40_ZIZJJ|nr:hypothetical protein FEM48_Zijuj05G0092400 [Ziziphus jujuba var. spinosa]
MYPQISEKEMKFSWFINPVRVCLYRPPAKPISEKWDILLPNGTYAKYSKSRAMETYEIPQVVEYYRQSAIMPFEQLQLKLRSKLGNLHVTHPRFKTSGVREKTIEDQEAKLMRTLRNAYEGTFIASGGYTRELGMKSLEEGEADLISYVVFLSQTRIWFCDLSSTLL